MSAFNHITHYAALGENKLVGSRCSACGKTFYPARPMCPACYGSALEAVEFSGKGKLAAYSVIYIAPTAMIQAGFDRKNPYCAAVVELEEGPRICAQLVGVDVKQPESIRIGQPVQATFLQRGEGESARTFLAFQP
ncbi:MAG: transcriptional regulator [Anaerolineae bacterium]|nr:MAG: transcriptional regulator [Anaerolineae bacterium]